MTPEPLPVAPRQTQRRQFRVAASARPVELGRVSCRFGTGLAETPGQAAVSLEHLAHLEQGDALFFLRQMVLEPSLHLFENASRGSLTGFIQKTAAG